MGIGVVSFYSRKGLKRVDFSFYVYFWSVKIYIFCYYVVVKVIFVIVLFFGMLLEIWDRKIILE